METLEPLCAGRYYHVYNRGNNGENLFVEERNYEFFLNKYLKYMTPVVDTFAYCLLRNHFHLLVRVKTCEVSQVDPSRQFSHLFNCYAKSMNSVYRRSGSLFQERFRRKELPDLETIRIVTQYIHMNPVKHRFVDDFRRYAHSSYRILLSDHSTFLKREEVFTWFGGKEGFEWFHDGSSAASNSISTLGHNVP